MIEDKAKFVEEQAEQIALAIGAESVLILAESNDLQDKTTTEISGNTGSLAASVTLARNYAMRQDTYVKRVAWDEAYSDDEAHP